MKKMASLPFIYDYKSTFRDFVKILDDNKKRAMSKKQEYLQKTMSIFKQFVKKCQKEIDSIINTKIQKLLKNYSKLEKYFKLNNDLLTKQNQSLVIAEFLIKPFERFPFSGDKNQKMFKQQYNLIQKASVLIERTLIDSFNQDQIPTFQNSKFFQTLYNHGVGEQSLTRLRINSQNFLIEPLYQIQPLQKNIKCLKMVNNSLVMLLGNSRCVQFWDIQNKICVKKFYSQIFCSINCAIVFKSLTNYLTLGFGDQSAKIASYRMDNWQRFGVNVSHTKKITKLIQYDKKYLISGSYDGSVCIQQFSHLKTIHTVSHISQVEDIILKNKYLYILLKISTVCEYEIVKTQFNEIFLQFQRSLSAGYVSLIRFPEVTSNFVGVACHIFGMSQIEITRNFKIEEINIINIAEMIADFVVLESKETSEFFVVCCFQNSSVIKIFSLLSQSLVYEIQSDYSGEVGVGQYMPKLQLTFFNSKYILALIIQSEFPDDKNIIKIFELKF